MLCGSLRTVQTPVDETGVLTFGLEDDFHWFPMDQMAFFWQFRVRIQKCCWNHPTWRRRWAPDRLRWSNWAPRKRRLSTVAASEFLGLSEFPQRNQGIVEIRYEWIEDRLFDEWTLGAQKIEGCAERPLLPPWTWPPCAGLGVVRCRWTEKPRGLVHGLLRGF